LGNSAWDGFESDYIYQMKFAQGRKVVGLSLVELMIVLALAALLTSLAAPSMRSLWVQRSVLLAAEALVSDLRYARSEALQRARPVLVCQSDNGLSCAGDRSAWAAGWLVFVDSNANGALDTVNSDGPADDLLRVQSGLADMVSVSSNLSTGHTITYQATGLARAAAQTLLFTPVGSVPASQRAVCISLQGRPRIGSAGAATCG
jgi:type IV fimbrial biogenesis protein FimT